MRAYICLLLVAFLADQALGHGMLWEPVNRASRWRFNASAPHNWNDNELFCGGFGVHHGANEGRCGLCGDNFLDPTPRAHELGGRFGEGVIVASYQQGSLINVVGRLTANHRGRMIFELCNIDQERESEECFQRGRLNTADDLDHFPLPDYLSRDFPVTLRLPAGLSCTHCVMRWTYVAANRWDWCSDGTGALGCGAQETFKSCADVRIN